MLQWDALKRSHLSIRETARTRWMIVNAAVTAYGMPKWKIARVSSFLAFSLFVRIVVCEIAGDTTNGIVDSRKFDAR